MQPTDFTERKSGRLMKHQRGYWAFVPNPLPPEIRLTWELAGEISAADRGLSELAGVARTLPSPHLLIRPFLGREAVLSSRIEGTHASLSDLFFFEAAQVPPTEDSDVREVHNYIRALEHGLKLLDELPVSMRLLREMHRELMAGVRGEGSAAANAISERVFRAASGGVLSVVAGSKPGRQVGGVDLILSARFGGAIQGRRRALG